MNPSEAEPSVSARYASPASDLLDAQRDFHPHPAAWINSLLAHAFVLGALLILNFAGGAVKLHSNLPTRDTVTIIHWPWPSGGGGDQSPTPPSRGALPPFSRSPLAPPTVRLLIPQPQIPVQASILGPPDLKIPEMMPALSWGDPNGVDGPPSGGPGRRGGIGTGDDGGVGPGEGPGYGPYPGDGSIYPVGNGIASPIPTYKPEPPYSEEARKAKHQGTVALMIVVGPDGSVTHAQIVRLLGMGLDEKARETVLTWKFRPGMRQGVPVAVRVLVEVSFRLF